MSHSRGDEEIFESVGASDQSVVNIAPITSKQPSKDIETSHLVPSAAFGYFHGQIYDNNLSAYENMLRDSKHKHRGEISYSLADQMERSRGAESPFQRFTRLKAEMGQLSEDLAHMTATTTTQGAESKSEVTVWHTLQAETSSMMNHLSTLETPCKELSETAGAMLKQHSTAAERLLTQPHEVPKTESESSSGSGSGLSADTSSPAFSRLEQRVYALELLLLGGGATTTDIASLIAGGAKTFPLLENLTSLERRVNLLDPAVLDVVSSKVSQLLLDLETLQKTQNKVKTGKGNKSSGSGNTDEQVAMLASKVAALDGFADELPGLLMRLKTLAQVHQEAASFSARMTELETSADELSALSQSNKEVMAALQEGFASNMLTFKANLESLDARIDKLS